MSGTGSICFVLTFPADIEYADVRHDSPEPAVYRRSTEAGFCVTGLPLPEAVHKQHGWCISGVPRVVRQVAFMHNLRHFWTIICLAHGLNAMMSPGGMRYLSALVARPVI